MSVQLPLTRALYLEVDGVEPIFGLMHSPPSGASSNVAVLLCPAFGWDDICSYRSRRAWAVHLAEAGHPTLRIDLPGSGDSGGSPDDPERLAAWTRAARAGADWLTETSGCARLAAVGIGLGGMVLCCALTEGAPINDLVLWAVPSRGRAFVRELSAFGRMESAKYQARGGPNPPPLPEGYRGAGGFVLSGETSAALEALDLTALSIPADPGELERVLLLERDGIGVDEKLREHLRQAGAAVSVAGTSGYGAMMAEPQEARAPLETFAQVESWLAETDAGTESGSTTDSPPHANGATSRPSRPRVTESDWAELTVNGRQISETALTIEQPFGRLFGILAEPIGDTKAELGAVLLNAGAIRRIGPNRMWVELARRWAARGVPTLRLDLEGLGDADGDGERFADVAELYVPELVDQVEAAIDELDARGVAHRFVLGGLCSGAYWSFHAALRDERVGAAFMVNPRTLFFDPAQETVRYLRRGLLQPASWRMIANGHVPLSRVGAVVRQTPGSLLRRAMNGKRGPVGADALDTALDQLRDDQKHLVFVFSESEPFYEELLRQGRLQLRGERWPNLELDLIPGRDHTLRPLYSQEHAHEALDHALDRELAGARKG
jgi:pimeloyl-ACP methyl ester carboxylesterase